MDLHMPSAYVGEAFRTMFQRFKKMITALGQKIEFSLVDANSGCKYHHLSEEGSELTPNLQDKISQE